MERPLFPGIAATQPLKPLQKQPVDINNRRCYGALNAGGVEDVTTRDVPGSRQFGPWQNSAFLC
jgi:hypothetical protein